MWNVNTGKLLLSAQSVNRINRNIVECKFAIGVAVGLDSPGINRNIVECKFETAVARSVRTGY